MNTRISKKINGNEVMTLDIGCNNKCVNDLWQTSKQHVHVHFIWWGNRCEKGLQSRNILTQHLKYIRPDIKSSAHVVRERLYITDTSKLHFPPQIIQNYIRKCKKKLSHCVTPEIFSVQLFTNKLSYLLICFYIFINKKCVVKTINMWFKK